MFKDLTVLPADAAGIVVRTIVVYAVVLAGIRLAGKRETGQLTPFDLVVLLLISNAVQNAMTGPDTTLAGGAIAAATLLVVNAAVAMARQRWAPVRRFVEGIPVMLIAHGQVQVRNLMREHMTMEDLLAALRQHDVANLKDVELAMLEVDGALSVIRQDPSHPQHLVRTRNEMPRRRRHNTRHM